MQIKKVTNYLLDKFPLDLKEDWDPSGFSIKFNLSEKLKAVVIAIDLTSEVLNKALEIDANLIITHHPFKFEKTWEEENLKAPYKLDFLEILKSKRINVISFHTNYDNQVNGTSYQIVKQLNLEKYVVNYHKNYPCLLNYKTTVNEIIANIKKTFDFKAFKTNILSENLNKDILKIAFLSGAGPLEEIVELHKLCYELIITSDLKWSDWIACKELRIPILEIAHLDEQVFTDDCYKLLKESFPNLKVEKIYLKEPFENL